MNSAMRRTLGLLTVLGCLTLPATAAATDLWDQNSGGNGTGGFSQQDNPPASPAPSELADDFFIPVGPPSVTVRGVTVSGHYDVGTASAASVDVRIYQDSGSLPGTLVAERLNVVPNGLATGDFEIPLDPGIELTPGNYWVSVMANGLDYPSQIWDWDFRTPQVGDPAAARTSLLAGCMAPNWASRSAVGCLGFAVTPDQMFSLSSVAPVVPVNPAPTPVVPTQPRKKCKKGRKLKKGKCVKKKKKKKR
jgi:hypothetical protein